MIDTTIYIKSHLLNRLYEVSSLLNISTSQIITLIVIKTMHNTIDKPCMFKSVKYQESDENAKWRRFHICLNSEIYEIGLDLRKVYKKSVSRIVAEGIGKYLDEIIREFFEKDIKNSDNYHHDYAFITNSCQKISHFTIFWSKPILKILRSYIF